MNKKQEMKQITAKMELKLKNYKLQQERATF